MTLQVSGAIATITVDRPGKRNALGLSAWRALARAAAAIEHDPAVGVVIVRGAGGTFGAGNDIAELNALRGDPEGSEVFGFAMAEAMTAIENIPTPVIMAIEGSCYGAGVALILAGDLRIASENAIFAITPAKLGALYLASDLHRVVAAVGQGQARRLLYTAAPVNASEAASMGLVDIILPLAEFETELLRLAQGLLTGSPYTLRRTKEMLRDTGHGRPSPETSASLRPFVEAMQGPDFAEGVSAFLNRRSPRFR